MILQLFIYSFAAFGLAFIIGHSKISLPVRIAIDPATPTARFKAPRRWLLMLIECPACLGFWEGVVFGTVFRPSWFAPTWSCLFVAALALYTCAVNLLLARVTGLDADQD